MLLVRFCSETNGLIGIGDDLLLKEVCFWHFHLPFHWNPWFFWPFFSLNSTSTDYDLNLNLRQHGKFTTTADGWPHQQCLDTENVAVSTSRMVWTMSLLQCVEINVQKAVWMMTPLYFIWMLTAMHFLDFGRYVPSGSCLHLYSFTLNMSPVYIATHIFVQVI